MVFYWTVYLILTIFGSKSNNNCKGIRKMLKNGCPLPVSEKRQRVTVRSGIEKLVSRDGTMANVSSLVLRAKVPFREQTYSGWHSISREHALLGQYSSDAHRYRIHPERFLDDRLCVSGSFQNFFRDRCVFVGQQDARFSVHFLLRVRVRRQMVQPETARIRALFNMQSYVPYNS